MVVGVLDIQRTTAMTTKVAVEAVLVASVSGHLTLMADGAETAMLVVLMVVLACTPQLTVLHVTSVAVVVDRVGLDLPGQVMAV